MSCSIFEAREAITSTYYRTLRAFDDNDLSLFNAAFAEGLKDIVYVFDEYETHGMDAIRERVFGFIGPMVTMHLASNIAVDLDDDCNTASLSAVVVGQHAPRGRGKEPLGPKCEVGAKSNVNFVQVEEGVWKVKKWAVKTVWIQGDVSVLQRPGGEVSEIKGK